MSLRDFNSNDDRIISLQTEPLGNGTGLDSFHTVHPEDVEPSRTPKIVGAVAVALMIGVAGVALYAHSTASVQPRPLVTASNLPAAPMAPIAAPTPQQQAAMTPDASTPAASNNTPVPAPVKTASKARSHVAASNDAGAAASARMAADSSQTTTQPQRQAVVVAEPVSPTPSPSEVAANNTQLGVPQSATTASDMPAPQPAPAPQETAPAQPAGQTNQ